MNKVFIGIGHGGLDPGAVAFGAHEADINLVMGTAMNEELVRHGIITRMSRAIDENDTLYDEIFEANIFKPDLAIDIHNNAGKGDGAESWRQTNPLYSGNSLKFAKLVELELLAIGQNSRGIKTRLNTGGYDYFGFLRQVQCPCIIIEGMFIDSNDRLIADIVEEQKLFGVAYAKAVLKYFNITYKPIVITPVINGGSKMKHSVDSRGLFLSFTKDDIDKIEYIHGHEPVESITSVYKRTGCDVIINANFFDMPTGLSIGQLVDEGKVLSNYALSTYGYGIKDKKFVEFDRQNSKKNVDFVGGYPCMLKDSEYVFDTNESGFNIHSVTKRGRTVIGDSIETCIIRCIPDTSSYPRKSVKQMADILKADGCINAINLDGGGSSQFISPWGKFISSRSVDGYLCIWLKKSTPSVNGVTIYTIVSGDTLGKIANKFNTSVSKIAKDNGILNINIIRVGQKLKIIK